MTHSVLVLATIALVTVPAPSAPARQEPPAEPPAVEQTDMTTAAVLVEEINRLRSDVAELRRRLAAAEMRAGSAERELTELRAFVEDHERYGDDFSRYRAVVEIAERDARERERAALRARREQERDERREQARRARAEREQAQAEERAEDRYRRAGFAPIGLDVFVGRMAYAYDTKETNPIRVDYDPLIGLYYRPRGPDVAIDYGRMTISGSVLNASEEIRNLGVAVTFFDAAGNQVGGEIVRINNARPDVPYPFTSTIEVALDRPFSSSSTYVLYADPIPAP